MSHLLAQHFNHDAEPWYTTAIDSQGTNIPGKQSILEGSLIHKHPQM